MKRQGFNPRIASQSYADAPWCSSCNLTSLAWRRGGVRDKP